MLPLCAERRKRRRGLSFMRFGRAICVFYSEISKCVGDGYNYTSGRIALLHRTRGRNSKPLSGSAAFLLTGTRPHRLDWLD